MHQIEDRSYSENSKFPPKKKLPTRLDGHPVKVALATCATKQLDLESRSSTTHGRLQRVGLPAASETRKPWGKAVVDAKPDLASIAASAYYETVGWVAGADRDSLEKGCHLVVVVAGDLDLPGALLRVIAWAVCSDDGDCSRAGGNGPVGDNG